MPPKTDVQTKVRLPKDVLKVIDDYRFENRLSSRNQAIIDLLGKGAETVKAAKLNGQASIASGSAAPEGSDA